MDELYKEMLKVLAMPGPLALVVTPSELNKLKEGRPNDEELKRIDARWDRLVPFWRSLYYVSATSP